MLERVFFLLLGAWLMNEYWGYRFHEELGRPYPWLRPGLVIVALVTSAWLL